MTPKNRLYRHPHQTITLTLIVITSVCGLVGCASSNKEGLSALDVSERQSANYGSGDKSRDRDADTGNIDLLKYKGSF